VHPKVFELDKKQRMVNVSHGEKVANHASLPGVSIFGSATMQRCRSYLAVNSKAILRNPLDPALSLRENCITESVVAVGDAKILATLQQLLLLIKCVQNNAQLGQERALTYSQSVCSVHIPEYP
jgi:hypothetical protein